MYLFIISADKQLHRHYVTIYLSVRYFELWLPVPCVPLPVNLFIFSHLSVIFCYLGLPVYFPTSHLVLTNVWIQKISIGPPMENVLVCTPPPKVGRGVGISGGIGGPNPSRNSNLAPYFSLKTFALAVHLPLRISIDLPCDWYGYFMELHNYLL